MSLLKSALLAITPLDILKIGLPKSSVSLNNNQHVVSRVPFDCSQPFKVAFVPVIPVVAFVTTLGLPVVVLEADWGLSLRGALWFPLLVHPPSVAYAQAL